MIKTFYTDLYFSRPAFRIDQRSADGRVRACVEEVREWRLRVLDFVQHSEEATDMSERARKALGTFLAEAWDGQMTQ